MLKLALSDGTQLVAALEVAPLPLPVLTRAGTKLIVRNVEVHRGMLLLRPESVHVLGGHVPSLEATSLKIRNEVKRRFPSLFLDLIISFSLC